MKTINLKLFSFNELPENIQDRIVQNWRNDDQYCWSDDNADSLNAFCDIFRIKIKDYDYGYRNYINANYYIDDDILNLSGIRLATYLWNNYKKHLFKGRYYSKRGKHRYSKIQIESDCVLTGFYLDNALIYPIIDFMNKPTQLDFSQLLQESLESWLDCCRKDYEYWLSKECIVDDILANEHLFLCNGELASELESMAA
jgi:hypothetical protein